MSGQLGTSWAFRTFRPIREKWWRFKAKHVAKGQAMLHASGEPEGEPLLTEMEWFVLMEVQSGMGRVFRTSEPERTRAFLRLVELNYAEGPIPLVLDTYERQIISGHKMGDLLMIGEFNKEVVAAAQRLANCGLIARVIPTTLTVH